MQNPSSNIPELGLTKLAPTPVLYRIYLEQARTDQFGFSFALEDALKDKKIEQLSDQKVRFFIEKYVSELPVYFYHFENEQVYQVGAAPKLYTNIISSSFDANGLLVLERFNSQIYDLRSFQGAFIDGPCHDLDLSIGGRYMMRSAENRPGFHVYSLGPDSEYIDADFYWDLDPFSSDFLNIYNRDQLELLPGKGILKRIENFEPPLNREQVFEILKSKEINYVCSPLLRSFYYNDREIAILGIQKEPLVYTLLSAKLQRDKAIQEVLFLDTEANLTPYLLTYQLNVRALLSEEQIIELIKKDRLHYHAFALYGATRHILLAAAQYDRYFFPFLEKNQNSDFLNDRELMHVLSNQSDRIFRLVSPSLLEDQEWVEEILVGNLHTLVYAPDFIKENVALLMRVLQNPETYKDFKLYHAHKDRTLQRFSKLFLEPAFKLVLLEHLPSQPLNDDLPF